eukprot:GILJ01011069.1.p1 GENE.GILJ01011069.1~~GILJ01011069.1.p1  ORF type:complete len:1198 (+),score=129.36 GILJ01011069.1:237-3830(+)
MLGNGASGTSDAIEDIWQSIVENETMQEPNLTSICPRAVPSTLASLHVFGDDGQWRWQACAIELNADTGKLDQSPFASPLILSHSYPREIHLSITMDRPFLFTDDLKWHWHKSWNLPAFSISLGVDNIRLYQFLSPRTTLKARLSAVTVSSVGGPGEACVPVEVGLLGSGTSVVALVDFAAVISGLRFTSTSYNHEGARFHLIITIYVDTAEGPHVLCSNISPGVFVDSRKLARESKRLKARARLSYFEPFPPSYFAKPFAKRDKKKHADEEDVDNTPAGLCRYFTAPNIRNKVRHPVFLAVRFSAVLGLFQHVSNVGPSFDASTFHHMMFEMHNAAAPDFDEPKETNWLLALNNSEGLDPDALRKVFDNLELIKGPFVRFWSNLIEPPVGYIPVPASQLQVFYSEQFAHVTSGTLEDGGLSSPSHPQTKMTIKRSRSLSPDDPLAHANVSTRAHSSSLDHGFDSLDGSQSVTPTIIVTPVLGKSPTVSTTSSIGPEHGSLQHSGSSSPIDRVYRQETAPADMSAQRFQRGGITKVTELVQEIESLRVEDFKKSAEINYLREQLYGLQNQTSLSISSVGHSSDASTPEPNNGVRVESAASTIGDTVLACTQAYQDLLVRLGTHPSLLLVWATDTYDRSLLSKTLSSISETASIHGCSTSVAVVTQSAFHTEGSGVALGLLGVLDMEGAFGTSLMECGDDWPVALGFDLERKRSVGAVVRQKCVQLTYQAMANAGNPPDLPELVYFSCPPPYENECLEAIQSVFGSQVKLVGSTPGSNSVTNIQEFVFGRNQWFHHQLGGIAITVMYTSVEVGVIFDSGYSPTAVSGIITKCNDRLLCEIDGEPAISVYNRWTGGCFSPLIANLSSIRNPFEQYGSFASLSILHPLGRCLGEEDDEEEPFHQVIHPLAVIPNGSIITAVHVKEFTRIHLLASAKNLLLTRIARITKRFYADTGISAGEIAGAMVFHPASFLLTGQGDKLQQKLSEALHRIPFVGSFMWGEHGTFGMHNNAYQSTCGSMMFSAVLFSKRRRRSRPVPSARTSVEVVPAAPPSVWWNAATNASQIRHDTIAPLQTKPSTNPNFFPSALDNFGNIIVVQSEEHYRELLMGTISNTMVVVHWTAQGSRCCGRITAILARFSYQYPHISVIRIEYEKFRSLANLLRIESIPTIHLLHRGMPVGEVIGDKPEVLATILENLAAM